MIAGLLTLQINRACAAALAAKKYNNLPAGTVVLSDGMTFAPGEKKRLLSRAGVEEMEGEMLKLNGSIHCTQIARDYPMKHHFAPGVYIREILMPAGAFLIGAEHTTEHFNIVLSGRASVIIEEKVHEIVAPDIFVSRPGVRKVLKIHETMRWQTVHANPNNETDIAKFEATLCVMSATYRNHFAGMRPAPPTE